MKRFEVRTSDEIQGKDLQFSALNLANLHGCKGYAKYSMSDKLFFEADGMEEQLDPFVTHCHCNTLSLRSHITGVTETGVIGYQSFIIVASMNGEVDSATKLNNQASIIALLCNCISII